MKWLNIGWNISQSDLLKGIGWKSEVPIGLGIRQTYNWVLEQVNGC